MPAAPLSLAAGLVLTTLAVFTAAMLLAAGHDSSLHRFVGDSPPPRDARAALQDAADATLTPLARETVRHDPSTPGLSLDDFNRLYREELRRHAVAVDVPTVDAFNALYREHATHFERVRS